MAAALFNDRCRKSSAGLADGSANGSGADSGWVMACGGADGIAEAASGNAARPRATGIASRLFGEREVIAAAVGARAASC